MHFDNTNRGVLFPNDQEGNDRRPNYKGTINVNGTEYELSGWKKSSKNGMPFLSLSVQPKRERTAQTQREPAKVEEGFSDEIPF